MFTFLLVVQALIAAILVGVILMQRSEGGGLGMGGSPSGLMSARGAADFLTRATTVLAALFVALCIALAVLAARTAAPADVDTSLARTLPAAPRPEVPLQSAPGGQPVTNVAPSAAIETAPPVPLANAPRRDTPVRAASPGSVDPAPVGDNSN